jgi:predicted RNA polymerase sigma factor
MLRDGTRWSSRARADARRADLLAARGRSAETDETAEARDLLAKLGRNDEAKAEFARAADMTRNERERSLLLDRASGTS